MLSLEKFGSQDIRYQRRNDEVNQRSFRHTLFII